MKKALILAILIFLVNLADSQVTQQWATRYNGPPGNNSDFSCAMDVDDSGNVYITGYSVGIGTGSYDYATIKYNSAGIQQWVSRYNGTGNGTDYSYAIAVDVAGNVYVTGGSVGSATNYYEYATVKYDAAGVQQWVRRYDLGGGSIARAIAVDGSGNVYVTGESADMGSLDYTTIKYNSSGVQQWLMRFNGPTHATDEAHALTLDSSGNVYVTGSSHNSNTFYPEYATVKYNSSGVQQWASLYSYPGNGGDIAYAIAVSSSGNVYVTGSSEGTGSNTDYATIKYNSSGDSLWVKRYNGPGNAADAASSLAIDGSGNVYVTGYSSRFVANFDYATIKYNSAGDSLWVRRYNGSSNYRDYANALALDGLGNVYVTGYSRETIGADNYTTIKYNTSGVQQWLASYNAPNPSTEDSRCIAVDGLGNVYVTGSSSTSTTLWDYATIKYSQTGSTLTLNLTTFIEGFYNSVSNTMISDTARVYLKNNSSPYNTVDSSKVILSSSGTGTFLFSNAVNGVSYYLVVKHRNSIETWSSSPITFTSGNSTYNFTTVSTQAYGGNMKLVDSSPVNFAIYSGDNNQDGFVNLTDVIDVYNAASNFINGYVTADMNGDNLTDLSDVIITNNNSNNFVSVVKP